MTRHQDAATAEVNAVVEDPRCSTKPFLELALSGQLPKILKLRLSHFFLPLAGNQLDFIFLFLWFDCWASLGLHYIWPVCEVLVSQTPQETTRQAFAKLQSKIVVTKFFIFATRSKFSVIALVNSWLLYHSIVYISNQYWSLLSFLWFKLDKSHLNASRLRSEYLIKTSKQLSLFWWQQTRLHSPGTSTNEGGEISCKKHLNRGRWFKVQSNTKYILTTQNKDHLHTNTQFSSIWTLWHHDRHKHRNILTIICKGKQGRQIEDQHQVTYRIIIYSLEGGNYTECIIAGRIILARHSVIKFRNVVNLFRCLASIFSC